MRTSETQQENIKTLLQLVKENQELEIVPMVDTECVQGDEFAYWMAKWGTAKVDEYYCKEEKIYFKSQDYDRLLDEELYKISRDNPDMQDDQVEEVAAEKVNSFEWIKAIVVYITEL